MGVCEASAAVTCPHKHEQVTVNPELFPARSYYAKLRQQEIERERELAEKYRDRAKERRDGVNKDYEETELISTTANYRAVGPTAEAYVGCGGAWAFQADLGGLVLICLCSHCTGISLLQRRGDS